MSSRASMANPQTVAREVITDIAEAGRLLADFTVQAAGSLEGAAAVKSDTLAPDEMGRRVKIAIAALKGEVPAAGVERASAVAEGVSPSSQIAQEIRTLITTSHGVLIDEGKKLEGLNEKAARFLLEFLKTDHPLRGGNMASHVILDTNNWVCIDRGSGGVSDIIPGSLGPRGRGLPGADQDAIIKDVEVNGVKLESPRDCRAVQAALNSAIAQHVGEAGFNNLTQHRSVK